MKIDAISSIDGDQNELLALSHKIHENPELGFEEYKASTWLASYLENKDFQIEKEFAGLATAFKATYGKGKPNIALVAEYDALPKLGHACGHNIIATASTAAAVALRPVADKFGGTITLIGTPAEEIHGGKIDMIRTGAFSDLDIAMMVHPASVNSATINALALNNLRVEFTGKPAHAAAQPHKGINALDALLLSFNNINALRQQIRQDCRIHGIITDGGESPNIIPSHSAGTFIVRSMDDTYLEELKTRVIKCFEGAAQATNAGLNYSWEDKMYSAMKNNMTLAEAFDKNMRSLGRTMEDMSHPLMIGSTDMGNVSQIVPSIHATVAIVSSDIAIHTEEFKKAAISTAGDTGLLDAAKTMTMTIIDVLENRDLLNKIKQEFISAK
jgi:amidohydrolase